MRRTDAGTSAEEKTVRLKAFERWNVATGSAINAAEIPAKRFFHTRLIRRGDLSRSGIDIAFARCSYCLIEIFFKSTINRYSLPFPNPFLDHLVIKAHDLCFSLSLTTSSKQLLRSCSS
jgi:hypothetical protein